MGGFPDYYIVDTFNEDLISLSTVKSYLRVDEDQEDSLLKLFTKSAIEYAESFTGLSLTQRLIEANFYNWKIKSFNFPRFPAVAIHSVYVIDSLGKKREIKKYLYNDKKLSLESEELSGYKLNIIYKAGYTTTTFPAMLAEALLAHIGVMYESRTGEMQAPLRSLNTYLKYKSGRL
jgi:uncharacterized phiE125 gp8 family phage protein